MQLGGEKNVKMGQGDEEAILFQTKKEQMTNGCRPCAFIDWSVG